jgi:acyl transferase domain-containing protein
LRRVKKIKDNKMALAPNEHFKIAVIGMSGRFPGARSLQEYWQNLLAGVESIQSYTDDELRQMGVNPEYLLDPSFVRAGSPVADRDLFAASLFGYSPREAELMDPQHRLFLECSWEALENAGYAPRSLPPETGVYAGTSLSTYMLFNLLGNPAVHGAEDAFQVMISNDKDFVSTRVSYKLNLKGPSFTLQSGCSTSLTAVHLAVQHLLTYQCDMAIAGGVSVGVPQRTGYHYEPNGIVSPDGHCRAFDAQSAGTLFGEGLGVVVLKRMEEALRDRDVIHAVILGSAVNNDGSGKVGYTAPSVDGQADVIARAHAVAGLTADTISYVEAHGTATALGDPVEVVALTKAFRKTTDQRGFCGLGTVKSNIGHLDAAAGIAGLIKVVLMLQYKQLVPSLHFHTPNPKIDFENSPFFVVSQAQEWKSENTRRAGVSSFGIGGTNVHMVLEEAPAQARDLTSKPLQILSLSAQTEVALENAASNLIHFLEAGQHETLADVAYTLHIGREQFKHRRSILCVSPADALEALRSKDREKSFSGILRPGLKAAFLFPGGGTQYPGMGSELYDTEPKFRDQIDLCSSLLEADLGCDLRGILYPSEKAAERAAAQLMRPSAGLPAIFSTEYALAQLLISWGVRPDYMLGHSLGEYAAACLAGVFSLEDALSLVAFRGQLLENLPRGAMLSVYLAEDRLRPMMDKDLSIAAINGPEQCVLSGPSPAIERFSQLLFRQDIEFHRLHIDAAAHSSMVETAMPEFRRFVSRMPLNAPSVPFISNLTGTWITDAQAADPEYWVQHLRQTVRYADGLAELMAKENVLALEVGPSRTLSGLAAAQFKDRIGLIHACMRHPQDAVPELQVIFRALAKMWNAGMKVDWQAFYAEEMRRRVPLPAYPFERERYWIAPKNEAQSPVVSAQRKAGAPGGVYMPSWKETPLSSPSSPAAPGGLWVLLLDEFGIGESLCRLLAALGEKVVQVRPGDRLCRDAGVYTVAIHSETDFQTLFEELAQPETALVNVVHLWSLDERRQPQEAGGSMKFRQTLFSFLALCKAIGRIPQRKPVRFFAVSNSMVQVSGTEQAIPEKSSFVSACRVAPQELENFTCHVIDVSLDGPWPQVPSRAGRQVLAEILSDNPGPLVAYRGLHRWVPLYRHVSLAPPVIDNTYLREDGVYLITGGTGELGPVVAHSFASRQRCKLILTSRSVFPAKAEWDNWVRLHTETDKTSRAIRKFQEIERKGSEVTLLAADISSDSQMDLVFQEVRRRFGGLQGVVHLAGATGSHALQLITDLSESECERQFASKIEGCRVLSRLLSGMEVDFCLLFSSTAAILGGAGLMAYAAANGFLDAFAGNHSLASGQKWLSINWDAWVTESSPAYIGSGKTALDRFSVNSEEAIQRMHEILACASPGQYIVSTGEIEARIEEATTTYARGDAEIQNRAAETHARPALTSDYAAPVTELQCQIAAVWGETLGVDKVGLHDNLFELGGNSLVGLRIASRLKRLLGVDVPVTALFEGPTVFAFSQIVSAAGSPGDYQMSKRRGELRRQKRAGHPVRDVKTLA